MKLFLQTHSATTHLICTSCKFFTVIPVVLRPLARIAGYLRPFTQKSIN